jgi:glycosyltransferase involved in cell wall biosynthesis
MLKNKEAPDIKICILNSAHPAHDTRVDRIATTLANCGYSITFISPKVIPELLEREGINGSIAYIEIRKAKGNFIAKEGIKATFRTFFSRILVMHSLFINGWQTKADVYHCNELDSWLVGILLKIILKKRLVFDVHEYYPAIMIEFIPSSPLKVLMEKIFVSFFSLLSRLTDRAIFVNQSIADLYKFKCKYLILRNLIQLKDVEMINRNAQLEARYKDEIVLLHIGPLREAYGSNVILDTLKIIKDRFPFKLVVLGGIQDSEENYQKKVREYDLENFIHIIEYLPYQQVLEYLNLASIGLVVVQPWSKNYLNSLSRKFLEYIGAGVPVIAPEFPEFKRLVEKYKLGLIVDSESPSDLAAAIESLAADLDMRKTMSKNGKTAFQQDLNWEKESKGLLDLYSSLSEL